MAIGVKVKNNDVEKALSIFHRRVKKAGILRDYVDNMQFEKPSAKRRSERHKAKQRIKRKNQKPYW